MESQNIRSSSSEEQEYVLETSSLFVWTLIKHLVIVLNIHYIFHRNPVDDLSCIKVLVVMSFLSADHFSMMKVLEDVVWGP